MAYIIGLFNGNLTLFTANSYDPHWTFPSDEDGEYSYYFNPEIYTQFLDTDHQNKIEYLMTQKNIDGKDRHTDDLTSMEYLVSRLWK